MSLRSLPISSAAVGCALLGAFFVWSCQTASAPHAARFVYIVNCSGWIYKVDLAEKQIVKSAALQDAAKDIPQGRGVDGCQAEAAAFDAGRSELVVIAPRDASGEQRRLQIIRLAASTLKVTGQQARDEFLPARILVRGDSMKGDSLLLGLGSAGDENGRILALGRNGAAGETWAGSGFEKDARMVDSNTILTREYRIVLSAGKAAAVRVDPQQLAAKADFGAYASRGIVTSTLADSAGLSALYLITTPGAARSGAVKMRLDGSAVWKAIPVSASQAVAGLHLSADGEQTAVENAGKLTGYEGEKQVWDIPAPRGPEVRFACSGPGQTYLYSNAASLTIVKAGSPNATASPLPQPLDPDVLCIAADR